MSEQFKFVCESRSDEGKGASRRLRREGKVPAIVYGGDCAPVSISIAENELMRAIGFESFFSSIIELEIEGKTTNVIIKDLQRHPYKNRMLHADFQRASANTELHVHVPLHFVNEEKSVGVKAGGTVHHAMVELHVACLPADLPEFIEVDIAELNVGEAIHISQITLPKGVRSIDLAQGEEHDLSVVSIAAPKGGASSDDAEGSAE
ncbi:MAG: 50S ribosomal protein L25/general stress protein Ctc [Gammaproteobacteria bacterium]|nr:50S ribosomal protein L25/general stress protein Ctc [Gammaproteobacteria bacterium]